MTPSWADLAQLVEECDDFQDFKRKLKVESVVATGATTRERAEELVEDWDKEKSRGPYGCDRDSGEGEAELR